MFLSRLTLNPECWQARHDIADPDSMHKALLCSLDTIDQPAERLLWRLEPGSVDVLVQTQTRPDWRRLPEHYADRIIIKQFTPLFRSGQRLAFRLRANPCIKKTREGRLSNRVPLITMTEQVSWLQRYGERGGFVVAEVDIEKNGRIDLRRGAIFESVTFSGTIVVTDASSMSITLAAGIGPSKAWGCGLLSVAPV